MSFLRCGGGTGACHGPFLSMSFDVLFVELAMIRRAVAETRSTSRT